MIADSDREHLLRFVLLDDEPVEMRLDVARQEVEREGVLRRFRLFLRVRVGAIRLRERRKRNLVTEAAFHEVGELRAEFF
ncbi:MAG TPA: hypothetical protein VK427_14005, partial [Kofleriaceae bacterium]|nr:hypothetical protein [Kofleriaceae bacterium]